MPPTLDTMNRHARYSLLVAALADILLNSGVARATLGKPNLRRRTSSVHDADVHDAASRNLCDGPVRTGIAGYSCTKDGEKMGDSLLGYSASSCAASDASWTAYRCDEVTDMYRFFGGRISPPALLPAWRRSCCVPPATDFCDAPGDLDPRAPAGHACLDSAGVSLGDSNFGATDARCRAEGHEWTAYSCDDAARRYADHGGASWTYAKAYVEKWGPRCCAEFVPPSLCRAGSLLFGERTAGHSCVDADGTAVGDSNRAFTRTDCNERGGKYVAYTCGDSNDLWLLMGGAAWQDGDEYRRSWADRCCGTEEAFHDGATAMPTMYPTLIDTLDPTMFPTDTAISASPTPTATVASLPTPKLCTASASFQDAVVAGSVCSDAEGNALGFSNLGYTQEECDALSGIYIVIPCQTALHFWDALDKSGAVIAALYRLQLSTICCSAVRRQGVREEARADDPTFAPTFFPTFHPTEVGVEAPTAEPTSAPTAPPTFGPTESPTQSPTESPTQSPTQSPTESPTEGPSDAPTAAPTHGPSPSPTLDPTNFPTASPAATATAPPVPPPSGLCGPAERLRNHCAGVNDFWVVNGGDAWVHGAFFKNLWHDNCCRSI